MRTRINDVRFALPASLALGAIAAITVAGCGAESRIGTGDRHGDRALAPHRAASTKPFALPPGWNELRLSSGALLPYPPGWRPVSGDRGSASAALLNRDGTIRAYLNATPAQSHETLAGWARFRLRHNVAEGDRNERLVAAPTGVQRRTGQRMACVIDDYVTSRSRYRELACILTPTRGHPAMVLVAAAQPGAWKRERPLLDLAINHFTA